MAADKDELVRGSASLRALPPGLASPGPAPPPCRRKRGVADRPTGLGSCRRLRLPAAPRPLGIADYSLDLLPPSRGAGGRAADPSRRTAGRSRDRAELADGRDERDRRGRPAAALSDGEQPLSHRGARPRHAPARRAHPPRRRPPPPAARPHPRPQRAERVLGLQGPPHPRPRLDRARPRRSPSAGTPGGTRRSSSSPPTAPCCAGSAACSSTASGRRRSSRGGDRRAGAGRPHGHPPAAGGRRGGRAGSCAAASASRRTARCSAPSASRPRSSGPSPPCAPSPRRGSKRVHLLIVGEAAPVMDLEGEARRAGVADRVHVTGFLPFEDFEAAIAAVDLCLNLRYPTAGETSASLLRVLAAGRPAIVSDFAQFADLPAEIAPRVPLGRRGARGARRPPPRPPRRSRPAAGHGRARRASTCAPRHDPARAAAAVVEACREWARAAAAGRRPAGLPGGPVPLQPRLGEVARRAGGRGRGAPVARGGAPARCASACATPASPAGWPASAGRAAWPWWSSSSWTGAGTSSRTAPGSPCRATSRRARRPFSRPRCGVRRGPAHLWIEPHLFGGLGLSKLGGPRWEQWI